MKKPYLRQSIHFTRANLNLRLNISLGVLNTDDKIRKIKVEAQNLLVMSSGEDLD